VNKAADFSFAPSKTQWTVGANGRRDTNQHQIVESDFVLLPRSVVDEVVPVSEPFVGEHDQRVHAVAAVIHRQLDARQQADSLLAGALAQRLEFVGVELIVVGDDGEADASRLQGVNIRADESVFVAIVFELLIRQRLSHGRKKLAKGGLFSGPC
jgi:hypothetical protein